MDDLPSLPHDGRGLADQEQLQVPDDDGGPLSLSDIQLIDEVRHTKAADSMTVYRVQARVDEVNIAQETERH